MDGIRSLLKAWLQRTHYREIIRRAATFLGTMQANGYLELLVNVNLRIVIKAWEEPGADPIKAHRQIPAYSTMPIGSVERVGKLGASIIISIFRVREFDRCRERIPQDINLLCCALGFKWEEPRSHVVQDRDAFKSFRNRFINTQEFSQLS